MIDEGPAPAYGRGGSEFLSCHPFPGMIHQRA